MSACSKFLFGILACFVVATLSGCFSARPEDIMAFTMPDEANVTMDEYILQPPDEITIIASNIAELRGTSNQQGQTQVIRPDGMISFENIGELSVAGRTPRQVAQLIGERLSSLYILQGDYPVDVRVRNQSKHYYVIGMVYQPGLKMFSGRETALSALGRAVPTNLAWKEYVQVIRPSLDPDVPPRVFSLNWRALSEHGRADQNVLLEEGDIIYVPPTILASIGLTIQEIVGPVVQSGRAVQLFVD